MLSCKSLPAFFVLCSSCFAIEPIGITDSNVSHSQDRLANLLHVNQTSIAFKAQRPCKSAQVRLDFYRNGKKWNSLTVASVRSFTPIDNAKITLQIADLDYLRLGGSSENSIRFHTELIVEGDGPPLRSFQAHDIPKSKCSLQSVGGAGALMLDDANYRKWRFVGCVRQYTGGCTKEQRRCGCIIRQHLAQ